MESTILYYTNNLLPKALFKHTINEVIKHAERNNCQLIICSHFPVFNEYKFIDIKEIEEKSGNCIEKNIAFDKPSNIEAVNLVTGKLPHNATSIFYQILYSLDIATGEHIFLMEHDCLYHKEYISTILSLKKKFNKKISFTRDSLFIDNNGYFVIKDKISLSGISGEKEYIDKIIRNKLKIYKQKILYFEPIFDFQLKTPYNREIDIAAFKRLTNDKEIIVADHVCVDQYMRHYILDIKHGLNAAGNMNNYKKTYFNNHNYWGEDGRYLPLIENVNPEDKMRFGTWEEFTKV